MTVPKCLFCLEAAVFDFGAGNLVCSACFEIRVLRGARVLNLNLVASGQHHPDANAAAASSSAQSRDAAADDPSFIVTGATSTSGSFLRSDYFKRRIS